MPDGYSANGVSPGDADDLFGGETGNGVVDPAAAAAEDGADAAAPEGMWLTASTWLPGELLEALGRCIPGEDGTPAVTTAFCQGGPLDTMPPGPALATFLAEATSPRGAATHPEGVSADPTETCAEHDATAEAGSTAGSPDGAGAGSDGTGAGSDGTGLTGRMRALTARAPTGRARALTGRALTGRMRALTAHGAGSTAGGSGDTADGSDRTGACGPEDVAGASQLPGLAACGDDALIGIIRGWRKIASLAAGCEMAAVAELAGRRYVQAKAAGEWDSSAIDGAADEVAAALTLTGRSAQLLLDRAAALAELPATAAALRAGRIDMPKVLVILTGLAGQDPELARAIEAQLIGRAPAQTTGQLRAALNRALIAADPKAAERRRQDEEKQARIERAPEFGGVTASLTGRYLPVPETVAAWNHVTAVARQLRDAGAEGTLDQLRVQVYLALLSGQAALPAEQPGPGEAENANVGAAVPSPAGSTAPERAAPEVTAPDTARDDDPVTEGSAAAGPGAPARTPPAASRAGGVTGTVNLTIPLTTLLGLTDSPGDLGGFGPITARTARDLAASTLGNPAVRWCVTATDDNGLPIGHGCATHVRAGQRGGHSSRSPSGSGPPGDPGWAFTIKLSALAVAECSHQRESSHYRLSPLLSHLIQIRNATCTAPGCRMPAVKCDSDHTQPYDQGGRTCECNTGPLCRHHHRVKQSEGWHLMQTEPGVFAWVTPSGWTYFTGPESLAA